MTVTLHLRPEVEAGLLKRASATGLDLEAYLITLVETAAFPETMTAVEQESRAEAVGRMLAFSERQQSTLNGPVTRALLHEGHRF